MAAEMVGGAFLSVSLQELCRSIHWMADLLSRNEVNDGLVNKLEIMLSSVSGVLNAAESKQITDKNVRQWVSKLKDVVCNAEDLVDEINSEALQLQTGLEGQSRSRILFKVRHFLPSKFNFKKVEAKILEILDQLEFIVAKKDLLGLTADTRPFHGSSSSETIWVKETDIYGRDSDREAIIKLLLSDGEEGGESKMSVIPIVGMGGIGKTTLVQLVYNDIDNVTMEKSFDIKAWIMVSDESDVFALTKKIYEKVTNSKNCLIEETFQLQLELSKFLENKKSLIVLDNVWSLNSQSWHELKSPFESAANGSKILVTTRNENIASGMGSVPNHFLHLLSEEDCWKLFSKRAFNKGDPSSHPKLVKIGKQIVNKCKGLPLAITSLAGLLHKELNPKKWNDVLQDEIWDLPQEKCKILPVLWLSYYYLPPHLKRCFAYCSIFPKGYEFEKGKLILLWMAEDLLLHKDNKMLEDIGKEYFDDLASRFLFHKNKCYGFTMHDLVNDLAKFVAGESYLRLDANPSNVPLKKIRHLSWTTYKTSDNNKLADLSKNKILRTLLPLDRWDEVKKEFLLHPKKLKNFQCLRVLSLYRVDAVMRLLDSIGKLKLLRYLDLSFTEIDEVPDTICSMYKLQTLLLHDCKNLKRLPHSIGNLKQLRYLDLSKTEVEELPETLCNLLDLHTLLLGSCRKLTRLPSNMQRLTKLRHLDISDTSVREMPLQISNLRHLEMLSDFVVGTNSESSIRVLGRLQSLHSKLNIGSLENVVNVDDVLEANLKDKKYITDLSLAWKGDTVDSWKAQEVLNKLQPHTYLEKLSIINYCGIAFSDWIGDHSFTHMVYLWLSNCKRCHSLPTLGQLPSLKSLHIDGLDLVEGIDKEFYIGNSAATTKPFKALEKLVFKLMPRWKEWSLVEGEVFSQLKELHLMDCPSFTLNGPCFADSLPSLTLLYISKCQQQVVTSFLSGQLPSLGSLHILYCPELESFPERRLPTNIHTVEIYECENLKAFSEEGWPSDLKSLSIGSCRKLFVHPMQWNLKTLTSLTSLHFSCIDEEVGSFPEEGKLPISLTSLKLSSLNNLKSLNGKAFKHLSSLEVLSISKCDQLNCLPQEKLPASLSLLDIFCCGSLKERCQREKGEDWHKIEHISRIRIDNVYI